MASSSIPVVDVEPSRFAFLSLDLASFFRCVMSARFFAATLWDFTLRFDVLRDFVPKVLAK